MSDFSQLRLIAAALLIALCAAAAPAKAESVLRVAMTAGDVPDWAGLPDQGSEGYRFVGYSLYEPLVNWDLSRSDIETPLIADLATKWSIDPSDHNRWIFELRQGVAFTDGCPWNAAGAVWNINRLLDQKAPAYNAVQTVRARSYTSNLDSVEKIDDYTIALRTKQVESLLPYELTRVLMISQCAMEKAGNNWSAFAKNPAGTGPYKFDRVVPHERLELVKNPDYWNKNRVPKHDRLVLIPMPEATTRAAALLSGQVDFIEAPSPDAVDKLKSAGMNVVTNVYPHTWDYLLNFQHGPFQDLRVRQAANFAINRDDIVALLNGTAVAAYGIFMATSKYYGHPFEYSYDPDKATQLLKEAKCYPCAITIAISTSGSGQMQPLPMNALVKSQLEAVGFKVTFDVMDWDALVNVAREGWQKHINYDGVNESLGSTDPQTGFLKSFTTVTRAPAGQNWGWYTNPEFDQLAAELMSTFDPGKQVELAQKAHEMIVKDAARLFIVDDLNPRALSPRLKGFVQAQSWFQDLTPIVVTDTK
ncbi:MAG TPA: ABC transporter substrate-binding protein [Beijerinckiaceae bacterium]|nr:ABC transporter substrate-binding protein [Beijerinckiaceae bacterium]